MNADAENDNELMIDLCTFKELRENNTFYNRNEQYKFTFSIKEFRTTICYIINNRYIHPRQRLDVKTSFSIDVASNHKETRTTTQE